MRNTKMCTKCQSTNIVRFNGYYGAYGSGNNLVTGLVSSVNVNRYVCCDCGFTEEWIDKKDLNSVSSSKKAIRPKNV